MRTEDYTEAMLALIGEGKKEADLLSSLFAVLTKKGHERLYPKILRTLLTRLERDAVRTSAQVTLARDEDASRFKKEIHEALLRLDTKDSTVKIDPTIIGGYIAEAKEKRIDASYKKSLLALYRSLISSR
jgi:F0F1-type ATP synthase delta subunit